MLVEEPHVARVKHKAPGLQDATADRSRQSMSIYLGTITN